MMKRKVFLLSFCLIAVIGFYIAVQLSGRQCVVECGLVCRSDFAVSQVADTTPSGKGGSVGEIGYGWRSDVLWTAEKMKDFLSGKFSGDPLWDREGLVERFFLYYKGGAYDREKVSDLLGRIFIEISGDERNGIILSVKDPSCETALAVIKFVVDDFCRSIDENEEYGYGKLLATFNHDMKSGSSDLRKMSDLVLRLKSAKEYFKVHRRRVRVLKAPCVKGLCVKGRSALEIESLIEKYRRYPKLVMEAKKRQIKSVYTKIAQSYMNGLTELMREYMDMMPNENLILSHSERVCLKSILEKEFQNRFLLSETEKTFVTEGDFERFAKHNMEAALIMKELDGDGKDLVQPSCEDDLVLRRFSEYKKFFERKKQPKLVAMVDKCIEQWLSLAH